MNVLHTSYCDKNKWVSLFAVLNSQPRVKTLHCQRPFELRKNVHTDENGILRSLLIHLKVNVVLDGLINFSLIVVKATRASMPWFPPIDLNHFIRSTIFPSVVDKFCRQFWHLCTAECLLAACAQTLFKSVSASPIILEFIHFQLKPQMFRRTNWHHTIRIHTVRYAASVCFVEKQLVCFHYDSDMFLFGHFVDANCQSRSTTHRII